MGAVAGAVSDAAVGSMQTGASIYAANKNYDAQMQTNASNERNVAATNKANMQIAQMNNEYNEKQLERQIQQEWDMWNAENEYNSASSQMQRLKDAGINPYLGNITPGSASSMSSPAAQPATPVTMQPFQAQAPHMDTPDFSGLRGVARGFVELLSAQEDVKTKGLQNDILNIEKDYKAKMFEMELYQKMQDAKLKGSQRRGVDIENMFKPEQISSELRQRSTDMMFRNLQAQGQVIANLSQLEWFKVLPKQIQQTIQEQAMRIKQQALTQDLTRAEINKKINEAMTEFFKGANEQQNFDFNSQTFKNRKRQIAMDIYRAVTDVGITGAIARKVYGDSSVFSDLFKDIE